MYELIRADSVASEAAVLVGVLLPERKPSGPPLEELEGLAATAGVRVVGQVTQRREAPDATTYLGHGKVEELTGLAAARDADVVIFDNDLSPAQTRNLERAIGLKVLDRTELILDIFASRAQTRQARLAVELAQLEYAMPRLKRMWTHLSRQKKGVGLRGPGETQLEEDRRLVEHRLKDLRRQLDAIERRKEREVAGRRDLLTVSLVGYTNAGKSTQKPHAVIDALSHFYESDYSNVHRGVHLLSGIATDAYEGARAKVQKMINAASSQEVVFVRGTTEAINLVAATFGRQNIQPGDEVVITAMEHHSNIVPWQLLCLEKGAKLRVAPITDSGELMLDEFERLLNPRTRLVSVVHVSNVLGTINPVKRIIELAHRRGIPVLIDGAQAAPHIKIDVRELDCDFYAFSSHKMYGPTGVGVLYGKTEHLLAMPPYQGGGDMISSVTFEKTTYNDLPYKFEAGTPNIAGVVALGAAVDYVGQIGIENIAAYEHELLEYATESLGEVPGLRLIGTAAEKSGVLSFTLEGIHPHDIGTILDREGIAIRTGHHCAQPLMERYGLPATARASLGMYNTKHEINALVSGLQKVIEVFA